MKALVTDQATVPGWFDFLDSLTASDGFEIPDAEVPYSELAMHCRIQGRTPTGVVLARTSRDGQMQNIWAQAEFSDGAPVAALPCELLTSPTIRAIEALPTFEPLRAAS